MSNDDHSDKDRKPRKNPWGNTPNDPVRGPWGQQSRPTGGGGHHGGQPPDLDELIRKAQRNIQNIMPGQFNGGGKIFGAIALILVLLWLATGIYIVQPGEQGVVQRFGAWSSTKTEEGVGYHLPWPLEKVTLLNVQELRRMSIGYLSNTGYDQPTQKRDLPQESLMLTSDRNIVDLDLVVQWNIKSAEDYLFNIQNQEQTIKKVAESAIREVVGQTDMFRIITSQRSEVAERAREILQKNLDDYNSGVNVSRLLIEKAEVHPEVQGAFQDVQSAKQDAEDIQNQAQAYREDIIPKARGQAIQTKQEAQGYKSTVIARAAGDASRFDSVLQAYRTGEEVTKQRIYIETMEQVLFNANKIILNQKDGAQGVVPFLPLNDLNNQSKKQQP